MRHRSPNSKAVYRKVLSKVISDQGIIWIHFCYVPVEVWDAFSKATNTDGFDISVWIRKWCKEDFDLTFKMARKSDVEYVKKAIYIAYQDRYFELFSPTLGHAALPMDGVIKNWTSLHMKEETVRYEQNKQ